MSRALDLTPLTEPVYRSDAAEFFAGVAREPGYRQWSRGFVIAGIVALSLLLLPFIGLVLLLVLLWIEGELVEPSTPFDLAAAVAAGLALALVPAALVWALLRVIHSLGRREEWLRLSRFAAANGLVFSPWREDPDYPGSTFRGQYVTLLDHFEPVEGGAFGYGTVRIAKYSTRSSGVDHGYLAVRLVHPVEPLTPHLANLLHGLRVEIVDGWLFAHPTRPFDLLDPDTHGRMARIIDAVTESEPG